MKRKERLELAEWIKDFSIKSGANQAAVSLSNRRIIEIEFRDKRLDKLKESTQNSLNLNIYVNQKYSGHSTNDLKMDSLKGFIKEAVAGTRYLTQDPFRSLPDPRYYPKNLDRDLSLHDQQYHQIESSSRVKCASDIEESTMAQSDLIISSTSWYSDAYSENVLVQSNGFLGESVTTRFTAGAEVTVNDEGRGRPEDYYYASCRYYSELPDPEHIGKKAAERALRKVGQEKIESGKYDMLVENFAGGRLLYMLRNPMRARALQQKSSYLEGMLGKEIGSKTLSLIDDPFIEKGLGSRLFDGEGIATSKRVMIEQGVLKQYYIDNYYGKKLEMEPNSGSSTNLVFHYGNQSQEEMIKEIEKGILVTGFIGGNSNDTTGDFSFGVMGQLIEKGQIIQPVNEMNISGNAKEFWKRLVKVGNNPNIYSSWRVPTMFFEDVHFSGI